MRKFDWIVLIGILSVTEVCRAQVQTPPPTDARVVSSQESFQRRLAPAITPPAEPELPRFNLEFPGGNPALLVESINDELKKVAPVNVIIPTEFKEVEIPAMKLQNVDVRQVFEALSMASRKTTYYKMRDNTFRESITSYEFRTQPPITTNSIWYFSAPRQPQFSDDKICRYYQLGNYLEAGLDVNDITTAIKAGAKMLGDDAGPELSFHKETRLLIAVGTDVKLRMIDEVLSQLSRAPSASSTRRSALPAPAEPAAK